MEVIRVPASERTTDAKDLFFIWFANNIGILGLVMGAMIVQYGLSFFQSVLAAAISSLSFSLVAYIAVIGKREGITTFVLSRAAFGIKGNFIPNFVAWLNLVGWLSVNVVTGTLIIQAIITRVFGVENTIVAVISLALFVVLVLLSDRVKPNQLAKIQTYLTYLFGGLTFIVIIVLIFRVDWNAVMALPSGGWVNAFWTAVSIIAAGTGINWTIAGADYGAYVRENETDGRVFSATTFGAFIPLFFILVSGVLIAATSPEIFTSDNPMMVIADSLPTWLGVVYLIAAVGGLIPQCIVSLRSAKTNLEALNINVSEKTSLTIHAAIMIIIPVIVLFFVGEFLNVFELFLGMLGILLASWSAVFIIDYILNRRTNGYDLKLMQPNSNNQAQWAAIISWFIGVVVGFLFTDTGFFAGPFAKGIFAGNSLGVLLAMVVSAISMLILNPIFTSSKQTL